VEVAENGGATTWKPAEVRAHLGRSRFTVCIDRDEDFIETYGEGYPYPYPYPYLYPYACS
jgi:hypothetical protein|tara:strand:- start:44 stop:223 length:180 start_codon:yes stop_codon:yes gene_type:complete